jgi:hypothetical protein
MVFVLSWKEVWREHIKRTGDFWVDRLQDIENVFNENEWPYIMRKKEMLESRQAQIVKSTINGRVFDYHTINDEDHINYRQHLAFLIKHDDYSYLEEQDFEKKVIFQGEVLKEDRILDKEGFFGEPKQLSFSDVSKKREGFYYDREAAVNYANKWWNDYNPEYPKFEVNDCTNYVSQCMRAGGAPMSHIGEKSKGWWCKGKDCSYSWSVANALMLYLSSEGNSLNAVQVDDPSQLIPGDVICYDWNGDGKWNHNAIVTGKDWDDMPLVNAHTINSRNRYWSYEDSPAFTENTLCVFFHIGSE